MTLGELENALSSTGIPVAYNVFRTPQEAPYICYIVTGSDNVSADNAVWKQGQNVQIELYTKVKDISVEKQIEEVLQDASLFFQSDEAFLDDENVYMKTYTIQIIGG